jgi:hypothetical protein
MRPITSVFSFVSVTMDSNLTAGVFTSVFFHAPTMPLSFAEKIIGLITVFQLPGK